MKKLSISFLCVACIASEAYAGDVINTTNSSQYVTTNSTQTIGSSATAMSYGIGNMNTSAGGAGGSSTSYSAGGEMQLAVQHQQVQDQQRQVQGQQRQVQDHQQQLMVVIPLY